MKFNQFEKKKKEKQKKEREKKEKGKKKKIKGNKTGFRGQGKTYISMNFNAMSEAFSFLSLSDILPILAF